MEPVNVSALIRKIIGLLQHTFLRTCGCGLELKHDLPLFEADVSQLQQVVMNLVINAAEAIEGKPGNVVVSTAVRVLSRESILAVRSCDELAPGQYDGSGGPGRRFGNGCNHSSKKISTRSSPGEIHRSGTGPCGRVGHRARAQRGAEGG